MSISQILGFAPVGHRREPIHSIINEQLLLFTDSHLKLWAGYELNHRSNHWTLNRAGSSQSTPHQVVLLEPSYIHSWITYHAAGSVYAVQVDLCHESDERRWVWVSWPTFHLQVVHPVFITRLQAERRKHMRRPKSNKRHAPFMTREATVSHDSLTCCLKTVGRAEDKYVHVLLKNVTRRALHLCVVGSTAHLSVTQDNLVSITGGSSTCFTLKQDLKKHENTTKTSF